MIRRRGTPRKDRFVFLKTAIFFLGAGTWIAGVAMDDLRVTAAAIVLLAVGIVLRAFPANRKDVPSGTDELPNGSDERPGSG